MNLKTSAALLALFCANAAAGQKDPDAEARELIRQTRRIERSGPLGYAQPEKLPAKDWTVMFFVNAKNNLTPFQVSSLNALERAGRSSSVHVAMEIAVMSAAGGYEAFRHGPDRVEKIPNLDMGSEHLADFISWAKRTYPAKKYMLVIATHGGGWRGLQEDEQTEKVISPHDIASALRRAGPIDVYYSQACLMQATEIIYELKDAAAVIIGSEDVMILDELQFKEIVRILSTMPQANAADSAQAVVDGLEKTDVGLSQQLTLSAARAEAADTLASKVDAWTNAIMEAGDFEPVRASLAYSRKYYDGDTRDLSSFVELVDQKSSEPKVKALGRELVSFVRNRLLLARAGPARTGGVSIYIPDPDAINIPSHGVFVYGQGTLGHPYDPAYNDLAWANASQWPIFLSWLAKRAHSGRSSIPTGQ